MTHKLLFPLFSGGRSGHFEGQGWLVGLLGGVSWVFC